MIAVTACGALNTVQDRGRFGARRWGVGTSGVMDGLALAVGNALLGNAEDDAAIEVQTFPFAVRFEADSAFAVTGADCPATLDDAPLLPWWAVRARAGQVLTLGPPRSGVRALLCVAGGVAVPVVLGSRSTYLRSGFGGHEGRALTVGDRLGTGNAEGRTFADIGAVPAACALPAEPAPDRALPVRVIPAGEYDRFPIAMQQRFWDTPWKVSAQSDRSGYRLSGPALRLPTPMEMRSYGVVPGIVQVPPSGEPIIQLSDANTAGGYPRMAGVIEADLWRLGQAGPGARIRFVRVDHAAGAAAMAPVRDYLAAVRRQAALHRGLSGGRATHTRQDAA